MKLLFVLSLPLALLFLPALGYNLLGGFGILLGAIAAFFYGVYWLNVLDS